MNDIDKYLTVHSLTKYIKYKYDQDPYLQQIYIKGELSNVKRHSNGHLFFTLKDKYASIRSVMFKSQVRSINFEPKEGQSVLVDGRISVFEQAGNYQIYVNSMTIDGVGLLFEQLEKDKKYLRDNGYLNASHKQELPKFPKRIAIVSSKTSAAIRDMLTTLKRRYPLCEILFINTLMQGNESKDDVIKHLKFADTLNVDLVILARGGGSIEDLWTFNLLDVSLQVFNMKTPIITGVGHETDTTLVDLVSDIRASTPTAAAEIAVPSQIDLFERIENLTRYLKQNELQLLSDHRKELHRLMRSYKLKSPELLYDQHTEILSRTIERLNLTVHNHIKVTQQELKTHTHKINFYGSNLHYTHIDKLSRIIERMQYMFNNRIEEKRRNFDSRLQKLNLYGPTKFKDYEENLFRLRERLNYAFKNRLCDYKRSTQNTVDRLALQKPIKIIKNSQEDLSLLHYRMNRLYGSHLKSLNQDVYNKVKMLNSLSPTQVLLRGYSYVLNEDNVVSSTSEVLPGDTMITHVSDGTIISKVKEVKQNE